MHITVLITINEYGNLIVTQEKNNQKHYLLINVKLV